MKIVLSQGSTQIVLPVNPEKIQITEKSKNKEQTVLNLGDVNIPDVRALNEFSFNAFFPFQWNHYCSVGQGQLQSPISYVNAIIAFKNSKNPIAVLFVGDNIQQVIKGNNNSNGLFLIESMDYEVRYAEEKDIYYSIKFKQYRNYEPRRVTVKPNNNSNSGANTPVLETKPPARPVTKPPVKTKEYIVRAGDNLWNIAKKFYGDGNLYTRIASANNIRTPSLIYPGQRLVIP